MQIAPTEFIIDFFPSRLHLPLHQAYRGNTALNRWNEAVVEVPGDPERSANRYVNGPTFQGMEVEYITFSPVGDGNCLYRAISFLLNREMSEHYSLRWGLAKYMWIHSTELTTALTGPLEMPMFDLKALIMTTLWPERYHDEVSALLLPVISRFLKCRIYLYPDAGHRLVYTPDGNEERERLTLHLGIAVARVHYYALIPLTEMWDSERPQPESQPSSRPLTTPSKRGIGSIDTPESGDEITGHMRKRSRSRTRATGDPSQSSRESSRERQASITDFYPGHAPTSSNPSSDEGFPGSTNPINGLVNGDHASEMDIAISSSSPRSMETPLGAQDVNPAPALDPSRPRAAEEVEASSP